MRKKHWLEGLSRDEKVQRIAALHLDGEAEIMAVTITDPRDLSDRRRFRTIATISVISGEAMTAKTRRHYGSSIRWMLERNTHTSWMVRLVEAKVGSATFPPGVFPAT